MDSETTGSAAAPGPDADRAVNPDPSPALNPGPDATSVLGPMGRPLAAVLVLASSAVVLVAEIVATRLIAPYVGITLETLSAVIGCVLAGISLGSWVGGALADRMPAKLLLQLAFTTGGLLLIAAPVITGALGPGMPPSNPSSAVVLTMAAFFLPSLALSAVGPCVLRGLGQGSGRLGSVAGSLAAISTAGALLGNFSAGFVLVGRFRVSTILIVCGAVCLALAALVSLALRPGNGHERAVGLALLVAAGAAPSLEVPTTCTAETEYVCLVIEGDRSAGFLIRSNIYSSSFTYPDEPLKLRFSYAKDVVAIVEAQLSRPGSSTPRFAYTGGGGYTLPLYFEARYPGSQHEVLEIDRLLTEEVSRALDLPDLEDRFPTRYGDARVELVRAGTDRFDVVVGDAFAGVSVPWHLTTKEYLEDVARAMTDGGLYVMNLIDYDNYGFARAEVATFAAVFDEVAVVANPIVFGAPTGIGANIVVIGGPSLPAPAEIDAALRLQGSRSIVVTGAGVEEFIAGSAELTDELAPVDQLVGRP